MSGNEPKSLSDAIDVVIEQMRRDGVPWLQPGAELEDEAPQVNPIVRAAADQVTKGKRHHRKNLHEPCTGQLGLFDVKGQDHDHNDR
ncbi:hypothetical protein [Nocardia sp. CA-120079]|uniref:hypothetical protein n=1 Tax=Nocardia sp. CA-120079 TaxID=3239974 RepID=UPI003D974FC9